MKINIANPATGQQKYIVVDDEKRLRSLYDKRISNEVDGSDLGSEYEGYVFRISGGNDKQGFAMKQGVLSNGRVRLLLSEGSSGYRTRRVGERKRKSVRGCIVGSDLSVLNLVVLRQGANQIEGLTDVPQPIRLGPKRASKIRALFNLSKEDKVTDNVICREFKNKKGKDVKKRPKVQRLVTPVTLKRKRVRLAEKVNAIKKSRDSAAVYTALLQSRLQEQNEARKSEISKRRSSRKASQKE